MDRALKAMVESGQNVICVQRRSLTSIYFSVTILHMVKFFLTIIHIHIKANIKYPQTHVGRELTVTFTAQKLAESLNLNSLSIGNKSNFSLRNDFVLPRTYTNTANYQSCHIVMKKCGWDQIPVLISKQNRLENFFTRKILSWSYSLQSCLFYLGKKAYFGQENKKKCK